MKIKDFDFFNNFGLDDLDEFDKNAINLMKNSFCVNSFFENTTATVVVNDALAALYTQNYMLLKQLLKINMKNDTIIQQNNQIIELLQKIADK